MLSYGLGKFVGVFYIYIYITGIVILANSHNKYS